MQASKTPMKKRDSFPHPAKPSATLRSSSEAPPLPRPGSLRPGELLRGPLPMRGALRTPGDPPPILPVMAMAAYYTVVPLIPFVWMTVAYMPRREYQVSPAIYDSKVMFAGVPVPFSSLVRVVKAPS